jgi:hypothetical protein
MFWIGVLASALSVLFFVGAVNNYDNYRTASPQLISSALFLIAAVICFK